MGHSWTFKTEYARYLWGRKQFSFATAEDLQFSYALQRHGIGTVLSNEVNLGNLNDVTSKVASMWNQTLQTSRQRIFCEVILDGFRTKNCNNCSPGLLKDCIQHFVRVNREM